MAAVTTPPKRRALLRPRSRPRRNPERRLRRGELAAEAVSHGGFEPVELENERYRAFLADAVPDSTAHLAHVARILAQRAVDVMARREDVAIVEAEDQVALADWFLTLPPLVLLSQDRGVAAARAHFDADYTRLRRHVQPDMHALLLRPGMREAMQKAWMLGAHWYANLMTEIGNQFLDAAIADVPELRDAVAADATLARRLVIEFLRMTVDTLPGGDRP